MTLLSTLKTRPTLPLRAPPRPSQRLSSARARASGPVRVRAQVLWHLHRKGDANVNAVIDLTDSIHDKRYVTVGDEGGAADDLSLPGVLRVGRVELAFEEEVVDGDGGEGGEGGGGHASSASSAAAPSSVTSSASSRVGGKRSGDPGRHRALVVTDIGSEALVLVNGRPLAKRERVKLSPGNVLSFRSMGQAEEREEAGVASCCCEYELYRNEFAHA